MRGAVILVVREPRNEQNTEKTRVVLILPGDGGHVVPGRDKKVEIFFIMQV